MKTLYRLAFCLASTAYLFCQSLSDAQIQHKLLAQPPQAIVDLSNIKVRGQIDPIVVTFLKADLDGSGSFRYVIALYTTESNPGGFLRVFKQRDNDLVMAGDQDVSRQVGGNQFELQLVDVNGDGIPEIKVSGMSADAQDQEFDLFSWTGSSLHDMVGNVVGNGSLEDIDYDGIMEIVTNNPGGKGFDIFKLSGSTYRFFKTVPQDPSGLSGPNGKINYVRAFCRTLEPQRFPITEIHQALAGSKGDDHKGDGRVRLTFGGLERVNAGPVPVEQVDTSTVFLGPHVVPIRVSVRPARAEDRDQHATQATDKDRDELCEKDHGRISIEIMRTDFLKALQRLHLDGPLAPGDKVEVRLSAKLKDGTPVGAVFTAKIVGDRDRDDTNKDHKDKPGN